MLLLQVLANGGTHMTAAQFRAIERHAGQIDRLAEFPTPHWRTVLLDERDYVLAHGIWRVAEWVSAAAAAQGTCRCVGKEESLLHVRFTAQ